jgi:hypothetical protein
LSWFDMTKPTTLSNWLTLCLYFTIHFIERGSRREVELFVSSLPALAPTTSRSLEIGNEQNKEMNVQLEPLFRISLMSNR